MNNTHSVIHRFSFRGLLLAAGIAAVLFGGCKKEDPYIIDGRLPGLFSVSATQQVRFSQGNLQWSPVGSHAVKGGGTAAGTWRFAEHQYDVIGSSSSYPNSYYLGTVSGSDNALVATEGYAGWMDLFGWGTSGYNIESPYTNSLWPCINLDTIYDSSSISGTNYDWGVYNAISNGGNAPDQWRTLTRDEWDYLINTRSASTVNGTSDARYALIRVYDGVQEIPGLLLLPDAFTWPSAAGTAPSTINGHGDGSSWSDAPDYTLTQFAALEAAGCVFLPASGVRDKDVRPSVRGAGRSGLYWSSTKNYDTYAFYIEFSYGYLGTTDYFRNRGQAVRLVQDKLD